MVFFTCNSCAEALKKNQVEKHLQRCRQCNVLSCVDCGKDFWGNDYQSHTKCITENEKYCGKGYVPKVNKGEVKQEQWVEKVQRAIESSASNPSLKNILVKLKDYPNIPRKKQKFENFLINSLRFSNPVLINQLWDILMSAADNNVQNGKTGPATGATSKNEKSQNGQKEEEKNGTELQSEAQAESEKCKLSKRERKEERRKQANKKEKKDKSEEVPEKKQKKRKHCEDEEENEVKEKKSKKKRVESDISQLEDSNVTEEVESEEVTEEVKTKRKKKKFDWETVIVDVLKSKGEMSLKKLRKKVLNEFMSQDAANYSEENLYAKFDKRVNKISKVKVFKDRVKLK